MTRRQRDPQRDRSKYHSVNQRVPFAIVRHGSDVTHHVINPDDDIVIRLAGAVVSSLQWRCAFR